MSQMPARDQEYEAHVRNRVSKPPPVLYKYSSAQTAQSVLSNRTLRFQSPLNYNDPFDSQWDPLWPTSTPEAHEHLCQTIREALLDPKSWPTDSDPNFRDGMDKVRRELQSIPENQRESWINDFVRRAAQSEPPPGLAEFVSDIQKRMRVLCLAESDRSLLMWSHYADEHRGFVLGFDTKVMEHSFKRPLEPMRYCDTLPYLVDFKEFNRSTVFGLQLPKPRFDDRDWALTKHSGWNYEREWRFAWIAKKGTSGTHEDFQFPQDSLVELVSGCRADPKQAENILQIARAINHNVNHYKMSPHRSRFELTKSPVS